jgi:hypothetical protein
VFTLAAAVKMRDAGDIFSANNYVSAETEACHATIPGLAMHLRFTTFGLVQDGMIYFLAGTCQISRRRM